MDWDQDRWLTILDRIEHRQAGIGLRFSGPPLWLEVTMEGPDSDAWSVAGAGGLAERSWNWESSEPCTEAMSLVVAGAGDDDLLAVVSRYTIQNLILNATHEIGEWLRFDARRPFPAHGPRRTPNGRPSPAEILAATPSPGRQLRVAEAGVFESARGDGTTGDGAQGNGIVNVEVRFDPSDGVARAGQGRRSDELATRRLAKRITDLAAPWRFSYLPGISISYNQRGPVVTDTTTISGTPASCTNWSDTTYDAVAAPAPELIAAVTRDVHRALILSETQRICDAFHVDGAQPWRLQAKASADTAPAPGANQLAVSVSYDASAISA